MDLTDILSKEVEVKAQPAVLEEEPETAVIEMPEPEQAEEDAWQEPEPKAMPNHHLAATIVGVIDGLQSSILPMLRKNALFTAKELEILDKMDTTGGTVYPANSPEYKVLAKWKKHIAFAGILPFTKDEKDRLIAATERYAASVQLQVSPFTGLLLAFGEVAGTRFAYFLNE